MEGNLVRTQKLKYDIALYWSITKTCNFDCPQCVGNRIKLSGDYAPEKVNVPQLKKFFAKHADKVFKVNFTGGEPLLVENILEAMEEISRKNYVALVTNLVSPVALELAKRADPSRFLYINASAHMKELEKRDLLEQFITHACLLKEKGFQLTISEVAYPFIREKVGDYIALFQKYGLDLCFNSFRGVWRRHKYPSAYTARDIELFRLEKLEVFRHDINYRKNMLCNAGYNNVVVTGNGTVMPCYPYKQKIGNIYDEVQFRKTLIRCPFKICACPFPVFEDKLFRKALAETGEVEEKSGSFLRTIRSRLTGSGNREPMRNKTGH